MLWHCQSFVYFWKLVQYRHLTSNIACASTAYSLTLYTAAVQSSAMAAYSNNGLISVWYMVNSVCLFAPQLLKAIVCTRFHLFCTCRLRIWGDHRRWEHCRYDYQKFCLFPIFNGALFVLSGTILSAACVPLEKRTLIVFCWEILNPHRLLHSTSVSITLLTIFLVFTKSIPDLNRVPPSANNSVSTSLSPLGDQLLLRIIAGNSQNPAVFWNPRLSCPTMRRPRALVSVCREAIYVGKKTFPFIPRCFNFINRSVFHRLS